MGDDLKATCSTAQSRINQIHQKLNSYVPKREYTGTKIFDDPQLMRQDLIALDKDPEDLFFNGLVLSKLPMRFRNFKTVWNCAPDQSSKSLRMQLVMHDADMEYQSQLKRAKKQKNRDGDDKGTAKDESYSNRDRATGRDHGRGRDRCRGHGGSKTQKPYDRSDRKSYASGKMGHNARFCESQTKNDDSSGKK